MHCWCWFLSLQTISHKHEILMWLTVRWYNYNQEIKGNISLFILENYMHTYNETWLSILLLKVLSYSLTMQPIPSKLLFLINTNAISVVHMYIGLGLSTRGWETMTYPWRQWLSLSKQLSTLNGSSLGQATWRVPPSLNKIWWLDFVCLIHSFCLAFSLITMS